LWKTKLPLKIKVFLWQLSHNKLQSAVALKKRGWKGDPYCCLCGRLETTKHIFFSCSLARFVWSGVGLAFSRDTIPKSLDDLQVGGIVVFFKTNMRLGFIMFAGFAWALWKARNKTWRLKRSFRNILLIQCISVFLLYSNGDSYWRQMIRRSLRKEWRC